MRRGPSRVSVGIADIRRLATPPFYVDVGLVQMCEATVDREGRAERTGWLDIEGRQYGASGVAIRETRARGLVTLRGIPGRVWRIDWFGGQAEDEKAFGCSSAACHLGFAAC